MKGFIFGVLLASSLGASAATFNGYECTDDCSGHDAGYNWAQEHDIDDEDDCSTPSNSFNEGCASYVEENAPTPSYSDDDEDEDEDY